MRVIVWGAGELGSRILTHCVAAGIEAIGYTKSAKRHAQIRTLGATARTGSPKKHLRDNDRLVLAISGSADQYEALASLDRPAPQRVILMSSVGYFDNPHGVIDESTPAGNGAHASRVAKTETAFVRWAGERGTILRLGGLYRPGRGPMYAFVRRGSPPPGPPDRTLALIHYDDAATATFNALQLSQPAPVYLGVTPPCPTREQFYRAAAEHADLPAPAFTEPLAKPPAEYDVSLLRRDLLPRPAFPDWRAALN